MLVEAAVGLQRATPTAHTPPAVQVRRLEAPSSTGGAVDGTGVMQLMLLVHGPLLLLVRECTCSRRGLCCKFALWLQVLLPIG